MYLSGTSVHAGHCNCKFPKLSYKECIHVIKQIEIRLRQKNFRKELVINLHEPFNLIFFVKSS